MSLIAQLLQLQTETVLTEALLQSIVKKYSTPIGSLSKVFGDKAEEAAELLSAKVTDVAYELKGTDPQVAAAKKSLLAQATGRRAQDEVQVARLTGARKVLVWKDRIITSKDQFDSLIEGVEDAPRHPLAGKVWNSFNNFLAPFHQNHLWVDDARGSSVCQATSKETAIEIAKLLNEAYPKKDRK